MIAPIADDPDPTTQIAWPARQADPVHADSSSETEDSATLVPDGSPKKQTSPTEPSKRRLSTWNLITLSISMAGAQIAWTIELGYVCSVFEMYLLSSQLY